MFYFRVFFRAGVPHFEAALRDVHARDPKFQLAAARRLGNPDADREEEALEGLMELGSKKVGPIRHAAIESLGQFSIADETLRKQACEFARQAMDDLDHNVRRAAVIATCVHAVPDEREKILKELIIDSRREMRFEGFNAASEFIEGNALIGFVKRGLADEDASVRFAAVRAAADHLPQEPALASAVLPALTDDDLEVKRMGAVALAMVSDSSGGEILHQALRDPEWRLDALLALASAPFEPAKASLKGLAEGFFQPLILKAAASAALYRLGDPAGVAGLRGVLKAFRSDGRAFAVDLVARHKVYELKSELEQLRRSPKTVPLEQIEEALASLG